MPARFHFRELAPYYNCGAAAKCAFVTADVDWAPDSVIEEVVSWFLHHEIPLTLFMTHRSEVALRYENHPLVEIGIHPDFSRDLRSHERVQRLREMYPRAIGSRSHRNICGRNCSDALKTHGLVYDVSKLLWGAAWAECLPMYNGMIEAAYVWEDGTHLEMGLGPRFSAVPIDSAGLKILAIHPALFVLNCTSYAELKAFTSRFADLSSTSADEFDRAKRPGLGMGRFCQALFLRMRRDGFRFLLLRDAMQQAYQLQPRTIAPVIWDEATLDDGS